jgi:hypothetical protein
VGQLRRDRDVHQPGPGSSKLRDIHPPSAPDCDDRVGTGIARLTPEVGSPVLIGARRWCLRRSSACNAPSESLAVARRDHEWVLEAEIVDRLS